VRANLGKKHPGRALENQAHRAERVADIVQWGTSNFKVLRIGQIELLSWLAALDDFRNCKGGPAALERS
jgi:hypothetical protein